MACKYISGCDLEINETAQIIMTNLLRDPQANAQEIQEFQARTKKIGSFQYTSDGLKNLTDVQEVIFNELPPSPSPLQPLTLYKYVIIRELDGRYKIYYSLASGIAHFSYIDYYVKKHYNQDGTPRVNAQGQRTPATQLFFVKNTSIPEKILFSMSWGNTRVKHEWFSLLKDYVLQQNAQNIEDFVRDHIHTYQNVFNAFDGEVKAIIEQMRKVVNINAYVAYENDWNTIVMGDEISHSCLTYALEVYAAGEFCTDAEGNIVYVDGWSGHFKTPQEYLYFIKEQFAIYGYENLNLFPLTLEDHLATSYEIPKCPDGSQNNNPGIFQQLKRSVTAQTAINQND
jgi:hypothetical protein